MYFATIFDDGFAHIHDDLWQLIGADVWMCINQDFGIGAMFYKKAQRLFDIASFLRTCVEFSVTIRTCTAFAKAIIGVRIHFAVLLNRLQIAATCARIFASIQHNRFQSQLDEFERSKITCWPSTNHKY